MGVKNDKQNVQRQNKFYSLASSLQYKNRYLYHLHLLQFFLHCESVNILYFLHDLHTFSKDLRLH